MTDYQRRPDFLLAGAMKSGSTTLDRILDSHPDITMASEKESGFFDRDDARTHLGYALSRTEEWSRFHHEDHWDEYLSMFPEDDTIKGESTVSYLYSRKAPSRASEYLNEPKALFILRDPVERTYSHYWHQLRNARTMHSFNAALKRDRSIIDYSIYPDKLQRWEQELGTDNIHVLLLEELIEEPQATIDSVFDFLGVDSTDIKLPKNNPGSFPRLPQLYQAFNLLLYILGKDTTTANLRDDEYWTLPEKAFRKLMLTDSKPSMDPRLREKLKTIFRKENSDILEYAPQAEQYWSIFED